MKLPMTIIFSLSLLHLTQVGHTFKADRERDLRRGRGTWRGNEHSERVTNVTAGEPTYAGNGCPQGTMRAVFAPDYLSFTLLFDGFVAEVSEGKRVDVMNCTIVLPLRLPGNMQMEVTRVDFRGFVGLPASGNAVLHSVFNFRGVRGDKDRMNLRYRFQGPLSEDYQLSSDVLSPNGTPDTEVSPCGGQVHLRISNQVRIMSRNPNETAMVTLDSLDGTNNAVYYVNWRRCRG